jgi:hypothetical protein
MLLPGEAYSLDRAGQKLEDLANRRGNDQWLQEKLDQWQDEIPQQQTQRTDPTNGLHSISLCTLCSFLIPSRGHLLLSEVGVLYTQVVGPLLN